MPGRLTLRRAARPKTPCVVPRSTSASIATSAGSETFFLPATSLIAGRKHADQPAANSCSGLVPAPGPPGDESLTSSRPSSLWEAPPSRPPVVCAFAVYRIFSRVTIRSLSRGWRTLRVHLDARRCAGYELRASSFTPRNHLPTARGYRRFLKRADLVSCVSDGQPLFGRARQAGILPRETRKARSPERRMLK